MTSSNLTHDSLVETLLTLYNDYRDALLNHLYYGDRLHECQRLNTILEIVVAVGASSAIGSWAIFRTDIGGYVWIVLGGVVAVVAVVKPFLKLSNRIERYSGLWVGLGDLYYDLDRLVKKVRRTKAFTEQMLNDLEKAESRLKELAKIGDAKHKDKLKEKCKKEVMQMIPAEKLWLPSGPENPSSLT